MARPTSAMFNRGLPVVHMSPAHPQQCARRRQVCFKVGGCRGVIRYGKKWAGRWQAGRAVVRGAVVGGVGWGAPLACARAHAAARAGEGRQRIHACR